jgi:LacI family transcriptional regulator
MATNYLAGRGCRRVLFLQGHVDSYAGQQRALGFLERSRELGLEPEILQLGSFERAEGRRAGAEIASRAKEQWPDGILAGNDAMALGILDYAYATGAYAVPRDFALIGFDDLHESAAPAYQLTTIHQPIVELAEDVVSLLRAWRARGERPVRVKGKMLAPTFVERRTGLWTPGGGP